jgi:2-aminoadipate transaminase
MWESLYSEVGRTLQPSPIRELLKLTKKPGMISFAGGMPDPDIFPVAEFEEASGILASKGKEVLQYGATEDMSRSRLFSRNGWHHAWDV